MTAEDMVPANAGLVRSSAGAISTLVTHGKAVNQFAAQKESFVFSHRPCQKQGKGTARQYYKHCPPS